MPENVTQSLRDIILIEADWQHTHAERLEIWARRFGEHEFAKSLRVAAHGCRARATILQGALIATAPEVLAKS